MRGARIFCLACLVLLSASLLLARVHPYGDAGLYARNSPALRMDDVHLPPEVRSILAAKCADCHSAEVHAPLYGRFAPVSWLMEKDIIRGRKAMNLAVWNSYSEDQRRNLSHEMVEMTRKGKMPLPQYRLIHWSSRINSTGISALSRWANDQSTKASQTVAAATPDTAGRQLFGKRCTGCHSLTQDGEGPRLGGVVGRISGSVSSYQYSDALKRAHIVWNETTLDKWLADPDQVAPGTQMDFSLPKAQERQQIIRYLKSTM